MLTSKMSEELVLVQESQLAIFTAWMAFVALVVEIAVSSVLSELRSRIATTFSREDLEMLGADLAVKLLVSLSHMLLQFVELDERRVIAFPASVL